MHPDFTYGMVMGYYGPIWSDACLHAWAPFMERYGHDFFLYAPKADPLLREEWDKPYDDAALARLSDLNRIFHAHGVRFGVGFSPYGLKILDRDARTRLRDKIRQLNSIGGSILGVFFDDVKREQLSADSARVQVAIAEYCASVSTADRFSTVPSYYTHDGIITRMLGPMPQEYLHDYAVLDNRFDIFWTGSHILSSAYGATELNALTDVICRRPVLWDNYPVNDPVYLRDFLFWDAPPNRSWQISKWCLGHALNPMIQGWNSMLAAGCLQALYSHKGDYDAADTWWAVATERCGTALAQAIHADKNYFSIQGLKRCSRTSLDRIRTLMHALIEDSDRSSAPPSAMPIATEIIAFIESHQEA